MSAEKIERFWKNATADDVVRVMKGEAVEARFRDSETQLWGDCYTLIGWVNERRHQWRSAEGGGRWNHCQVYREPSWWLERPDPGRGWRLLGKFPDEPKLATDEAWDCHLKEWRRTFTNDGNQVKTVWYRRRVEEVEPGPKHYVLRVGDTVETPSGHLIKVVSLDACQMQYELKAGYTATLPNGQTITITDKGFEVKK